MRRHRVDVFGVLRPIIRIDVLRESFPQFDGFARVEPFDEFGDVRFGCGDVSIQALQIRIVH